MVVDDFFQNCSGKLKYFYKFKKIIMLRNPIGILYENLHRNRVEKQIDSHPWQTSFHYDYNGSKIPWFVDPKKIKNFLYASRIEKYLMFMNSEYEPYLKNSFYNIPNSLFLFIEDIWKKPNLAVNRISKFLKTKKTKDTSIMLSKLDLPRKNLDRIYEKQFYYLKNLMSDKEFKSIIKLEKKYVKKNFFKGL